ncbi:uncharacterized protein LOC135225043 [Macrobrachium nipponense]|uniref:uncharacterized protein LOC135225043 n=1 Tax=Macrobrachium nipponense TaxID=159736 RepID=UPI0030C81370
MAASCNCHLLLRAVVVLLSFGLVIRGIVTAVPGPSVYYIESSVRQFFMAPNLTFQRQTAMRVFTGYNRCECQDFCFALGSTACQAWSLVKVSGQRDSWECRLINVGPETTELLPDSNASYYFKKSSVSVTYSWKPDKLFYVALSGSYGSLAAKARCVKIPGHRLIIVKSRETFYFFSEVSRMNDRPFWVSDLRKISLGEYKWGDGSNISVTNGSFRIDEPLTSNVFISSSMKLDNSLETRDGPYRGLCQANPLGIGW